MTSSQPPPNRGYHQSAPSQIYVPVVSLHSNGTYSPKQRIHTHPIRHSAGTGIHLPLPPPTAPPPYPPVMMTIPPPPIHHIGVHPPFSSRPPPPISTSPSVSLNPGGLNHTTNGGIQMPQHVIHQANSSVHIHHGHLVGDGGLTNPLQPPQASSMEPQAYYSHSALAHHHHSIVSEMSPMSSSTHSQDLMSVSAMPYTNGCSGSEADHSEPTADYHDPREHNQNPERNLKNKEKTPMCLINELARHNKTTHQYRLTDESGPSHKKNFIVCLKLGDTEEYLATGPSIKKAQHAAAAMALEKTKLKHPPSKSKQNTKQVPITPTVELNTLAMKRGESAVYTFIDPVRGTPCHGTSHTSTKFVNKKFQNGGGGLASIRVSLKIGDREFIGQASTAQAAKHDAAMNALKVLKNLSVGSSSSVNKTLSSSSLNPKSVPFVPSSSCYSTTNTNGYGSSHHKPPAAATAVVVKEEEEVNKDLVKSPISLVHESALKRNLVVQFDVTKETGPPHMRKFITTCRCGDFITEGEGNGKKTSKKQAAELMLEQLRQLPPVISCQLPLPTANGRTSKLPRAGSKKAELKKKKAKNLIKMEQKAAPDYGQSINPISRLIQIQQAKKEKEPVYTLIAEKGMPRRREFVMQVTVGNCSAKGSGPNKKLAKRAAAEALLQELGYSPRPPGSGSQPGKPVLKPVGLNLKSGDIDCSNEANTVKKLTFSDEAKSSLANTPGIIILPTSNDIQAYSDSNVDVSSSSNGVNPRDSNHNNRTEKNIQSILSPKRQLSSLAEVLGLKVTYRHINKRDKNDNFVSLVKLTTTPPKVFYGSGNSLEMSEVDAAAKALLAIADSGIDEDPEQTC